ncbi:MULTISPECIES: MIP/aquaporin family protein [unclassified Undibacterium]|uniref:MIP/aquaporin family protein n=1 Tax=unclassified Undibacterium TaxID=2630295 RepID=UPI002AC8B8AA|nr:MULTISPECIES: MIP/aquaporin family protein [unclassified Undibacterium]MEB0137473.1 MIP/aquaporin family protein [Undibacterium sp. CCC2.1]MEB0170862.1 MIP/aquaporin family protein [Undibacterium sp. CCC1.1]MEB0174814.1 MIP/aquaporin family protein [Undibacterium sp. CCC3.4]MEB0214150.1 MIP/aquaporin family protein [Undibacterium sp. 5I2]WPX44462.1 MIP/aquaporin family protein [Undibacterium sp. CCC3.4]
MHPLLAEFIGTALLVLLGDGVVANVLLTKTKGHDSGLIVIAIGWGMAVFIAVFCSAAASGGHLNPAVTLALALADKFPWGQVLGYVTAQMAGGLCGALLVWVMYRQHFDATTDADAKLAVFCTGPAIRHPFTNVVSEVIATFVLVFAVLNMAQSHVGLGAINALPVGLLVLGIGVSLGGTTGYAMSPARDLAPRIMHALLPIAGKRDSDWAYAWVPVVGPLLGAAAAAFLYNAVTAVARTAPLT